MNDGSTGERDGSNQTTDREDGRDSSWPERFLMAVSTIFTLLLFAYVIWQGATTPAVAEPTASVTGTETLPNGEVKVTVTFRNAQAVGLVQATVEVDCSTPPPELTFEHVPADDRRTGYVVCPAETENPTATVSTWVEA